MQIPLVYLAGPMSGLHFADAQDWRARAQNELLWRGIETLSPMREKSALAGAVISGDFREYAHAGPFYSSKGIITRDHTDVTRADALLVNLLGAARVSIGTVIELAWAWENHKPVVVVIEPTGNPHDNHPMLIETMQFRVDDLETGIDAVAVILNR